MVQFSGNEEQRVKFTEMRNEVLEEFNHLDYWISQMISFHYFKGYWGDFVQDVLYDVSMSSHSRMRIFRKIAKQINIYDSKMHDFLEKMGRIRNVFAHCMTLSPDKNKSSFEVFGVKKTNIDFNGEYKQFKDLIEKTLPYMDKIWKKVFV